MERNIKIKGITLKKIAIGESNLGLTLITEDDQVLFVVAFGAAKVKSKLFEGTSPFVYAMWDLYHDPVKDHWRAKEVSVISYNNTIQESLDRFYTGSFFLEVALKTPGSEGMFRLLNEVITLLGSLNSLNYIFIQFILRVLHDQGILPSFSYCSECGSDISTTSLYYFSEDRILCSSCSISGGGIEISPGIAKYCQNTTELTIDKAVRIGLEKEAMSKLKVLLIELIRNHTSGKLLTLDTANGLI